MGGNLVIPFHTVRKPVYTLNFIGHFIEGNFILIVAFRDGKLDESCSVS